jgi:hypothetical protein
MDCGTYIRGIPWTIYSCVLVSLRPFSVLFALRSWEPCKDTTHCIKRPAKYFQTTLVSHSDPATTTGSIWLAGRSRSPALRKPCPSLTSTGLAWKQKGKQENEKKEREG